MYKPPLGFHHSHWATIYPALFRRVPKLPFKRERIYTHDADFLDLDWLKQNSLKLIILSHGLEGSSQGKYIRGMAQTFFQAGYDVLAWNCRSCSGELNLKDHFYHSGMTVDLNSVVEHAFALGYQEINLIGFSMGGNLTMKYLGEGDIYPKAKLIHKGVAISAPLSLKACAEVLQKKSNLIYTHNFLMTLKEKVRRKVKRNPNYPIPTSILKKIKDFHDFDELVTAPLGGFTGAEDYWKKNSALYFLPNVSTPSLVLSSFDDPILGDECFPLLNTRFIKYDYQHYGGHVGFTQFAPSGMYWSEEQALNFIRG